MVGLADDVRSWDQSGPPGYAARGWGVVKSLGDLSSGPVALVHRQKVRFFSEEKPHCFALSFSAFGPKDGGATVMRVSAPSPFRLCLILACPAT
jgi:hypothetical protein